MSKLLNHSESPLVGLVWCLAFDGVLSLAIATVLHFR